MHTQGISFHARTVLSTLVLSGVALFATGCTSDAQDSKSGMAVQSLQEGQQDAVLRGEELPFKILGDLVTGRFTGDVYFKALINHDEVYNFPQTNNITFAPGARSFWHCHGPMILIGTGGVGYYQEEGQPTVEIHPGDVVFCKPDVRHWHGATGDSWFSQIVIYDSEYQPAKPWPKITPVSDADYARASQHPVRAAHNLKPVAAQDLMFAKAGEPLVTPNFSGNVYVSTIINPLEEEPFASALKLSYVVFEPGVINNYHLHKGGQILIATDGVGYHQLRDGSLEILTPGDVAFCPPGCTHWHGGSRDTTFAHIAITTNPENTAVTWMERISPEEQAALPVNVKP